MSARRRITVLLSAAGLLLALAGCSMLEKGEQTITRIQKSPVMKAAVAVRNSFADITDEEEYYIGRSVAALILARYPVYQNTALTLYVNKVGLAVAAYSDRPEIYAGYHFLILDSDEINALSAPGGFIFITRGLLAQCRDEEMLAAVLAHEVGHVAGKHGLQAIKKSRLIDAFKLIGSEAAAKYSPADLAELTDLFQGALSDIAGQLIERGYDRTLEYEADGLSVKFTTASGYNPGGLTDFLKVLASESETGGWFQTHPTARDRLGRVTRQIDGLDSLPKKEASRTARFRQAVAGLK
jgi:predicted Zn-dependent protease